MKLTPDQTLSVKEWNEIISTKVESSIGSELNGKFTAANYPAGFNYQVKLKNYNAGSLMALNNKLVVEDELPSLDSGYSSLYEKVIGKIHYNISKEDQQRINREANEQAALISSIITAYKESDIDEEIMKDPTVPKIMAKIKKLTDTTFDKVNLREYPYLSTLCNLLSEFTRKAVFTSKIQRAAEKAEDRLEAIAKNIKTPTEENGGLKTDDGYVCGWYNIMEPIQLLKSLEEGNSVSFGFSANNFHEKSSHLIFNNKVHADVPVDWFFHMGLDHEDKFDLNQYAADGAQVSVKVTYNGITIVPATPAELSVDNKKGWYASDILEETAAKSGKDVTGYQLVDSEFEPKTLFGKDGKLRRMRTLVISQLPSIKLHFSKFDCARLQKSFKDQTELNFQIFGGLITGSHDNSYSFSEFEYDEKSQSLDVELKPKPLGSYGTAENQAAYVLGGVIDYFDTDVEVNKIRLISDGDDAKNMTASETDGSLKLKYRKNESGRYEFAGFYDEKEDTEYQLGDTVAVPITSRYISVDTLPAGLYVENIHGSSYDKCPAKTWISYWSEKTKISLGDVHCVVCDDWQKCPHNQDYLEGAHVVVSGHNVTPRGDESLYIIPICKSKNNISNIYPMKLQCNVPAIRMDRFLS